MMFKRCENCKKEHDSSYGSGRFCSSKCARGFSTKAKRKEINEKVSQKLRQGEPISKPCKLCKTKFTRPWSHRHQQYCSVECANKNALTLAHKKNKQLIKEGKFQGWKTRNILSYPEKFWIKVLTNNNLIAECQTNYPISKRDLNLECDSNYFLDFYFEDKKLDLEIDGKQHDYTERKKSDKRRDEALIKNGITVYRIKWKSINNDVGKAYMKAEIEKFIEFYKNF